MSATNCIKCGEPVEEVEGQRGWWFHAGRGFACTPAEVDPEALSDYEPTRWACADIGTRARDLDEGDLIDVQPVIRHLIAIGACDADEEATWLMAAECELATVESVALEPRADGLGEIAVLYTSGGNWAIDAEFLINVDRVAMASST